MAASENVFVDSNSNQLLYIGSATITWPAATVPGPGSCMQPYQTLMQSTNPKNILQTLQFVRAGLASGLLSKEEVIDWADEIITRDETPDIFFIDLALSSSKSTKDICHYINDFLNFENPVINGRPLLGLLYKKFHDKEITLEQTVHKLFRLKFEALFTQKEEGCIYSIDDALVCAKQGIYGTVEDVHREVDLFLSIYKDYTLANFEKWNGIDEATEQKIEQIYQQESKSSELNPISKELSGMKPWWKFW